MRYESFSLPGEAVEAFRSLALEVPRSELKKCFEDWFHSNAQMYRRESGTF